MSEIIKTERFKIYRQEVTREEQDGLPRTIFHAWFTHEDIPRPVCVISVNESFCNYVEWIHVEEWFRRKGIATEVLRAIDLDIGCCTIDAATEDGEAFCDSYETKFPSEIE